MLDVIFSWTALWWLLLFLYVPACIGLIIVVLLQKGKGVGFAGAFGGSAGGDAIFGPRSSKSLPQKITYVAAGIFMGFALILSMISGKVGHTAAPELVKEEAPAGNMQGLFSDSEGEGEATAAVAEGETAGIVPTPQEVTTESGQKVNVVAIDPATGKQMDVSGGAPAAPAPVEAAPAPAAEATPATPAPAEAAPAPAAEATPATPAPAEAAPVAAPAPATENHTESAPETPAQ